MDWTYKGEPFDPDEEERSKWVGFIYCVTDTENGKKYIGKKKLWSTTTKPPLKGKKRKRKFKNESDWKKYYGSSEALKLLIENTGTWRFERRVLCLCATLGEMSYCEAYVQFLTNALIKPDDFYNRFIGCKIHAKHVGKLDPKKLEDLAVQVRDDLI